MPVIEQTATEFITALPPEDALASAVADFLRPYEDRIRVLASAQFSDVDNEFIHPLRQRIIDTFIGIYSGNVQLLTSIFIMRDCYPDDFIPALLSMYDPATGMTLLHIAIGLNDFPRVQYLVELGPSPFIPDIHGRMPSTLAEICEVDDELLDYVVEHEP